MPARSIARIVASVNRVSSGPTISLIHVTRSCERDILCAANLIAGILGPRARLEAVIHPDTDSIRRVVSQPSLDGWTLSAPGHIRLLLKKFGRKAVTEIATAIEAAQAQSRLPIKELEIDLRQNHGGDLKRMLRAAGAFIGPVKNAVELRSKTGVATLSIPARHSGFLASSSIRIRLIVGPRTASSAEIFAALLRVHGGASIHGARTFGKNYLLRIIPLTHDWRLVVPAETVSVPGTTIASGLVPDGGKKYGSAGR